MLRDGTDRPLCWTMRHRITSFRAVEPKLSLSGRGPGGTFPPVLRRNVIHSWLNNKSCMKLFCCQNQCFGLVIPSLIFPSATIFDHPAHLGPAGPGKWRCSGGFDHEAAAGKGHGIQQCVVRGEAHFKCSRRACFGTSAQQAPQLGRGNRQHCHPVTRASAA